jgi:hypothetical protein
VVLNGLNSVLEVSICSMKVLRKTDLVVVDVLLSVDGLGGLDVLLGSYMLLNDFGCDLGADLSGVLFVGSLI